MISPKRLVSQDYAILAYLMRVSEVMSAVENGVPVVKFLELVGTLHVFS